MNLVTYLSNTLGMNLGWLILLLPLSGLVLWRLGDTAVRTSRDSAIYRRLWECLIVLTSLWTLASLRICVACFASRAAGSMALLVQLLLWVGYLTPSIFCLYRITTTRPVGIKYIVSREQAASNDTLFVIVVSIICALTVVMTILNTRPRFPGLECGVMATFVLAWWSRQPIRWQLLYSAFWPLLLVAAVYGAHVSSLFVLRTTQTVMYGGHLKEFAVQGPLFVRVILWLVDEPGLTIASFSFLMALVRRRPHSSVAIKDAAWSVVAVLAATAAGTICAIDIVQSF